MSEETAILAKLDILINLLSQLVQTQEVERQAALAAAQAVVRDEQRRYQFRVKFEPLASPGTEAE